MIRLDPIDYINTGITMVAAIAAIFAAYFSGKAPSKEDLARVERNTAETTGHLRQVHSQMMEHAERDELTARADRVAISVRAKGIPSNPFVLHLTVKDAAVVITGIELCNEAKSLFGTFQCERVGELEYDATIETSALQQWFSGGTASGINGRLSLILRVSMQMAGFEAHRSMPVTMSSATVVPDSQQPSVWAMGWSIEGNV